MLPSLLSEVIAFFIAFFVGLIFGFFRIRSLQRDLDESFKIRENLLEDLLLAREKNKQMRFRLKEMEKTVKKMRKNFAKGMTPQYLNFSNEDENSLIKDFQELLEQKDLEINDLRAKLGSNKDEIKKIKKKLRRKQAEIDKVERRFAKDKEESQSQIENIIFSNFKRGNLMSDLSSIRSILALANNECSSQVKNFQKFCVDLLDMQSYEQISSVLQETELLNMRLRSVIKSINECLSNNEPNINQIRVIAANSRELFEQFESTADILSEIKKDYSSCENDLAKNIEVLGSFNRIFHRILNTLEVGHEELLNIKKNLIRIESNKDDKKIDLQGGLKELDNLLKTISEVIRNIEWIKGELALLEKNLLEKKKDIGSNKQFLFDLDNKFTNVAKGGKKDLLSLRMLGSEELKKILSKKFNNDILALEKDNEDLIDGLGKICELMENFGSYLKNQDKLTGQVSKQISSNSELMAKLIKQISKIDLSGLANDFDAQNDNRNSLAIANNTLSDKVKQLQFVINTQKNELNKLRNMLTIENYEKDESDDFASDTAQNEEVKRKEIFNSILQGGKLELQENLLNENPENHSQLADLEVENINLRSKLNALINRLKDAGMLNSQDVESDDKTFKSIDKMVEKFCQESEKLNKKAVKISQFKEKISKLESERNDLAQTVDNLQKINYQSKETMHEKELKLAENKDEINKSSDLVEKYNLEMTKLKNKLKTLKANDDFNVTQISKLKREYAEIVQKKTDADQRTKILKERSEQLKKNKNGLLQELTNRNEELKNLNQISQNKSDKIEKLNQRLKSLNNAENKISLLQNELDEINKHSQDQNCQINELKDKLRKQNAAHKTTESEFEKININLKNKELLLNEYDNKNKDLIKKLVEMQNELNTKDKEIHQLIAKISELESTFNIDSKSQRLQLETLTTQNKTLLQTLNERNDSLQKIRQNFNELKDKLVNKEEQLKQLNINLKIKEDQSINNVNIIKSLQEKVLSLEKISNKQRQQIIDSFSKPNESELISHQSNELKKNNEIISELEQKLSSSKKEIYNLNLNINEKNKQLEQNVNLIKINQELVNDFEEKNKLIYHLQQKLHEAGNPTENTLNEIENKNKQLQNMQEQIVKKNKQLKEFEEKLHQHLINNQQFSTESSEEHHKITLILQNQISELKNLLNAKEQEIESLKIKINNFQNSNNENTEINNTIEENEQTTQKNQNQFGSQNLISQKSQIPVEQQEDSQMKVTQENDIEKKKPHSPQENESRYLDPAHIFSSISQLNFAPSDSPQNSQQSSINQTENPIIEQKNSGNQNSSNNSK